MVLDESKWQTVKNESEKRHKDMANELEEFKKKLLLNKSEKITNSIDYFSHVNIDSALKNRFKNHFKKRSSN